MYGTPVNVSRSVQLWFPAVLPAHFCVSAVPSLIRKMMVVFGLIARAPIRTASRPTNYWSATQRG